MAQEREVLLQRLEQWFAGKPKVAVALSGGIDSSLVAFAARRFLGRDGVLALISTSESLKVRDLAAARNFARDFDIPLVEINSQEMLDPNYRMNPVNRCYFCKTALYGEMEKVVASRFPGCILLNGSNTSDFGDYRPGLKAAEEHHVFSPLADCGFLKEDIRLVARHYGLPHWNKPASPCLSSRFPYGVAIDPAKLAMVERAEDLLNDQGFDDVRVRYFDGLARLEVPADQVVRLKGVLPELALPIRALGFTDVEVDDEGLVSGKLNRSILYL